MKPPVGDPKPVAGMVATSRRVGFVKFALAITLSSNDPSPLPTIRKS
jgi:hypothetical protein